MTPSSDLRVIFRVAAGPRRGFGHLVRSISLARAMGVRPLLSLRGPSQVTDTALALGADVLTEAAHAIRLLRPDVVVIDDPVASATRHWIAAARRAGALVVTVHDLGIGCADGDVVIDGSVTRPARVRPSRMGLTGARYAILDPALTRARGKRAINGGRRVLVALGGGPRREVARAIAEAITAADPRAQVRVAGGFAVEPRRSSNNITWIAPRRGLRDELSRATVAVVGGGVSLYEACAIGVPTIGVPVVASQTPTVRAFAKSGAAIGMPLRAAGAQTAAQVVALLDDPRRRAVLRRRSMRLIDGRGAARAAAAVLSFAERKRS